MFSEPTKFFPPLLFLTLGCVLTVKKAILLDEVQMQFYRKDLRTFYYTITIQNSIKAVQQREQPHKNNHLEVKPLSDLGL